MKKGIEAYGIKCLLIKGDISKEKFCKNAVRKTIRHVGKIDLKLRYNVDELYPIGEKNLQLLLKCLAGSCIPLC